MNKRFKYELQWHWRDLRENWIYFAIAFVAAISLVGAIYLAATAGKI